MGEDSRGHGSVGCRAGYEDGGHVKRRIELLEERKGDGGDIDSLAETIPDLEGTAQLLGHGECGEVPWLVGEPCHWLTEGVDQECSRFRHSKNPLDSVQ